MFDYLKQVNKWLTNRQRMLLSLRPWLPFQQLFLFIKVLPDEYMSQAKRSISKEFNFNRVSQQVQAYKYIRKLSIFPMSVRVNWKKKLLYRFLLDIQNIKFDHLLLKICNIASLGLIPPVTSWLLQARENLARMSMLIGS